jgi:hypothetical protein
MKSLNQIVNKLLPGRKEAAQNELITLSNLLGKALKANLDMQAAQIRKRMKLLRAKYPDIE